MFAPEVLLLHEHEEGVMGEDLKVNWSARGGETAGEVEGGGGEERGELLWVAWNISMEKSCASTFLPGEGGCRVAQHQT